MIFSEINISNFEGSVLLSLFSDFFILFVFFFVFFVFPETSA